MNKLEFNNKIRQLRNIAKTGNVTALKGVNFKLNEEYSQILKDFHQLSAKLFLLRKLRGESTRLINDTTKKVKAFKRKQSLIKMQQEEQNLSEERINNADDKTSK